MANNTILNPGAEGDTIATEDISGVKHELVKVEFGVDGVATKVSASNPLPVTDNAADVSLASMDIKLSTIITLLAGLSSIEVAATKAAISPSTNVRLIYVIADESNFGLISLYIYNGTALKFIITIA